MHHAGVAVKLMQVKVKYKILVYIFNKRLVYKIIHRLVLNFKIKKLYCIYIKRRLAAPSRRRAWTSTS